MMLEIFLSFLNRDNENSNKFCRFNSSCIRLCCAEEEICEKQFLKEYFNGNFSMVYDMNSRNIIVIFAQPGCNMLEWDSTEMELYDGEL